MPDIGTILEHGYFPKEIPPPFTTSSFASLIKTTTKTGLPRKFNKPTGEPVQCSKYNLARVGTLRRPLSISNPLGMYHISREITDHWDKITRHCRKSRLANSRPVWSRHAIGRCIEFKYALNQRSKFRLNARSGHKFILKADIARCYPSIYTHALPWALHGKDVAKSNIGNMKFLGNRLDKCIRFGQDNQTIGVPIGPDSGYVASEIVLCAIDEELQKNVLTQKGFRYIDDYEFPINSISEAESILNLLQEQLSEFELELNPRKTNILDLPQPIETPGVAELRAFDFSDKSDGPTNIKLIHFFERAFELSIQYPEDPILKYAISCMNSVVISKKTWGIYLNLLFQCAVIEPGTLPFIFIQLMRYYQGDYNIPKDEISKVIENLITAHSPVAHGSEIAWAIWFALVFNIPISAKNSKLLVEMSDPVVALLTLHANSEKLLRGSPDFSKWASMMTTEQLYGEQWLLAYEANKKKWLRSVTRRDHVNADPTFYFLKKNNVCFYDETLASQLRDKKRNVAAIVSRSMSLFIAYLLR